MNYTKPYNNSQVGALQHPQASLPSELDKLLYTHIADFVKLHSWVKLEEGIAKMVDSQYSSARRLVEANMLCKDEVEKDIKSRKPSRTYLKDFYNGRAICLRYTNSIANFFDVSYTISIHNPCSDFLERKNFGELGDFATA